MLYFHPSWGHMWCTWSFLALHENWDHRLKGKQPHLILGSYNVTETQAFSKVHSAHQVRRCLCVRVSVESGFQGACLC